MYRTLIGLLLTCLALPALAQAQWQWLDKDGRRVFSDRSPPADVPEKSIIKRPGSAAVVQPLVSAGESQTLPSAGLNPGGSAGSANPAAVRAPGSAPQIGGRDKELLEKKRLAEEAEKNKTKEADAAIAKQRADNCEQARRAVAIYTEGGRITKVNAKGEREFLDDASIAQELRRAQAAVQSECR